MDMTVLRVLMKPQALACEAQQLSRRQSGDVGVKFCRAA
jgi:hypothetical protein